MLFAGFLLFRIKEFTHSLSVDVRHFIERQKEAHKRYKLHILHILIYVYYIALHSLFLFKHILNEYGNSAIKKTFF